MPGGSFARAHAVPHDEAHQGDGVTLAQQDLKSVGEGVFGDVVHGVQLPPTAGRRDASTAVGAPVRTRP